MEYLSRSRLPVFTPRLDLTAEDLNAQAETLVAAINELAGRIFIIKDMIKEEDRAQYAEEPSYPILDEINKIWADIQRAWTTIFENREHCDQATQELHGIFDDLERRLNALDDAAARKVDLADLLERINWIRNHCVPSINPETGNWWIGSVDTGVNAIGHYYTAGKYINIGEGDVLKVTLPYSEDNGTALGTGTTAATGGTALGKGATAGAGGVALGEGANAGSHKASIGSSTNYINEIEIITSEGSKKLITDEQLRESEEDQTASTAQMIEDAITELIESKSLDANKVLVMTGEEIANLGPDDTMVVLCTTDYTYRDAQDKLNAVQRGYTYEIVRGRISDVIITPGGGGGGGDQPTARSNYTVTISPLEQNISISSRGYLRYKFETTALPATGTAKLFVNGVLRSTQTVNEGANYFEVTKYLKSGTNYFTVTTADRNNAVVTLDYIINAVQLTLTSNFNANIVQSKNTSLRYALNGYGSKTVHFEVDKDIEKSFNIDLNGTASENGITVEAALATGLVISNGLKPTNSYGINIKTCNVTQILSDDSEVESSISEDVLVGADSSEAITDIELEQDVVSLRVNLIYSVLDKTQEGYADEKVITRTVTQSTSENTETFNDLYSGTHKIKLWADVDLDGDLVTSNVLEYDFLVGNPAVSGTLIHSAFNKTECIQGDLLEVDYLVYDPSDVVMPVNLYINNVLQLSVEADRTKHIWNLTNYPLGDIEIKIESGTTIVVKRVHVERLELDIEPVSDNLQLYLTAQNRSNQEAAATRDVWEFTDEDENTITAQLTGFNWLTNGWIDSKLKFTGECRGYIPLNIFGEDIRRTGKTIEFEVETYDPYHADAILASCFSDNKGLKFTSTDCLFKSEQTEVKAKYGESSKVRITFVVESTTANRLIKTYINGILSGLKQYSNNDNFEQNNPVGITINEGGEEIDIACIRVYKRALNSQEVLNNFICDLDTNAEKLTKYSNNLIYDTYGAVSYTRLKAKYPTLTITGSMPTYKGDKKNVSVLYENAADPTYDFELADCQIDVQGTSSVYYPRKNWKIKFPNELVVREGAIPEKTYTMKADFMDTSHSHNAGTANFVNEVYDPEEYFPTRTSENNVRDAIYGFPCVIFHKETEGSQPVFYGTYMFNNDKTSPATLGLTTDAAESWEFKNNTSDHCLFKTDDFTGNVADNLEARWPKSYETNPDYSALQRVYSWVVSCIGNPTKFKNEFENYFSLHYTLVYAVIMEVCMLVDSRAKNMFLDTTDGLIWYPRFYDMDTCWGLNNEGELKWGHNVEIHDRVGSAYVWDDQGESRFWNLVESAFSEELKDTYAYLRNSYLTYENIVNTYVTNISEKFSEAAYNEDAQFKYVDPLINTGDTTYLYAAQGSRAEFFKQLVRDRLAYMDSKYEYGSFNTNYATMRLYTTNGDFNLQIVKDGYAKIRYGSTDVKQKVLGERVNTIQAPQGLIFNDTETIIWGADNITDLGDISNKYPGTVDITRCHKLTRLIIGNADTINTNLISLSIGNQDKLTEINVRNCPNLSGELDLSHCSNLETVEARGSGLTSVVLPETGTVKTVNLGNSIQTLILRNQVNLTTFNLDNWGSVRTLYYENSAVNLDFLLAKCSGLSRLRAHFNKVDGVAVDYYLDQFINLYDTMRGIDDEGFNTEHPVLTGYVNLIYDPVEKDAQYIAELQADFAEAWPNLTITWEEGTSQFAYQGYSLYTYSPGYLDVNDNPIGEITYWHRSSNEDDIQWYGVKAKNSSISGNVFVPTTYKNKPVKIIEPFAFQGCSQLLSVTIPQSISMGVVSECACMDFVYDSSLQKYKGLYETQEWFCVDGYPIFTQNGTIITNTYTLEMSGSYIDFTKSLEKGRIWNPSRPCYWPGQGAFRNCSNLLSVNYTWPTNSVMPTTCFNGCSSIESIGDTTNVKGIYDGALGETNVMAYYNFPNLQILVGYNVISTSYNKNNISTINMNFNKFRSVKILKLAAYYSEAGCIHIRSGSGGSEYEIYYDAKTDKKPLKLIIDGVDLTNLEVENFGTYQYSNNTYYLSIFGTLPNYTVFDEINLAQRYDPRYIHKGICSDMSVKKAIGELKGYSSVLNYDNLQFIPFTRYNDYLELPAITTLPNLKYRDFYTMDSSGVTSTRDSQLFETNMQYYHPCKNLVLNNLTTVNKYPAALNKMILTNGLDNVSSIEFNYILTDTTTNNWTNCGYNGLNIFNGYVGLSLPSVNAEDWTGLSNYPASVSAYYYEAEKDKFDGFIPNEYPSGSTAYYGTMEFRFQAQHWSGLIDLGKSFPVSAAAHKAQNRFKLTGCPNLTAASLADILTNVYDIASLNLNTQDIYITSAQESLLSSSEYSWALETVTTLGWTLNVV